jgi:hypothetical protein
MEWLRLAREKSLFSLWSIYIKFIFFTLLIFLILADPQANASVYIKAEVDKTSIRNDETLTYRLSITSDEKNIPLPKLPEFSGFLVVSQNQSSTVSIGKGRIKTKLLYIFILAPKITGKVKIEPASIKIRNHTYYTDSFEIEIKENKSRMPSDIPSPKKTPYETESQKVIL